MKKRIAGLMLVFVGGCSDSTNNQDLESFITKTYAVAEVTSTPLPPEPKFEPLAFAPVVSTDPFVMPQAQEDDEYSRTDCWQPHDLPGKDPLESFELSSLQFKGVIGTPGSYWALVESPDATIHRIGPGRMLGSNRGQVKSISQHTLSLTEHLPDGLGCWTKRNIKVAMVNKD
ncbi:pilus assembly protein PilP [Enterovibrio nigricans]|uniref:Type IV pilus assembly protein PilP n=1 Tax=Enterovibrio nigricans DSM 22720 TaxID=1121868 RepID=A0A1T4U8K6_9GAMM|nr:pilus assembly protein PilP [Enterovibrio nigricans]PKF51537.1 pilus assembly protein PilP [Enterovibrio nigricans]SKA49095.1 type IV pilus assembly protein PilP [Enterovibrio nigricans DSM 22720]